MTIGAIRSNPPYLVDSGADLEAYGMGDRVVVDIARTLNNGFNLHQLRKLNQVAFLADEKYVASLDEAPIRLPRFRDLLKNKQAFGENFVHIETESNRMESRTLVEPVGDRYVVVNPPYPKLSEAELDHSFDLPYSATAPPPLSGQGDDSGLRDDQVFGQSASGVFRRLQFLYDFGASGKICLEPERTVDPQRGGTGDETTRLQGVDISDLGGPSANMYRMGGRDERLWLQMQPALLSPSVAVPESEQRPYAVDRTLPQGDKDQGGEKGLYRQRNSL